MFVYKMYSKFRHTFIYILYTKCIQNVYKMFVNKMYLIFEQTFVYILYTLFPCGYHYTEYHP